MIYHLISFIIFIISIIMFTSKSKIKSKVGGFILFIYSLGILIEIGNKICFYILGEGLL